MGRLTNYQKFYGDYLRQYEKSKAFAGMAAEDKMSYAEFKVNFDLAREEDKRSGGIRIAEKLARNDVYSRTAKQSRGIYSYVKQHNIKVDGKRLSYYDIRTGNIPQQLWQDIIARRNELLSSGYNDKTVRLLISEQFFGSP